MSTMTGPEHYSHAEKYLTQVDDTDGDTPTAQTTRAELLARAQAHATLALAAATALAAEEHGSIGEPGYAAMNHTDLHHWKNVAAKS